MHRKLSFTLLLVLSALILVLTNPLAGLADQPIPPTGPGLRIMPQASPSQAVYVPGRLLVKFEPQADARASMADMGLQTLAYLEGIDVHVVAVSPGTELATVARLSARPDVAYAEPDYLLQAFTTPSDPYYADYQWNLVHINADDGWNTTTGSSSVTIAIVDTGVDLSHPDLTGKIVSGYDFVNNDSDPSDDQGHGTHVASIAAASANNNEGIVGVSWGARVMPIKTLDANGNGALSDVADGIRWAADHGAQIINLSLGGSSSSSTLQDAVNYAYDAGALLVAAAGNEYDEGNPTSYPAAYDHVLAVSATDDQDDHATYSNSGSYVDVAAPGGDPSNSYDSVPEHWIIGAYWRGSGYDYAWLAGTSQAAPQVAGLAALLLSVNSALTNDELEDLIRDTAVDVKTAGWDEFTGDGRIDVNAAIAAAATQPTATPTRTRTATPTSTRTNTPIPGATNTATTTPSATPTVTRTTTQGPTATRTNTPIPGATNTATTTPSATPTARLTAPVRPTGDVMVNDDPATGAQTHPAIATDLLGNAAAVWKHVGGGPNRLVTAFLPAFSSRWGPDVPIPGSQQAGSLGDPAIAIGGRGEIFVAWHDDRTGDDDIYVSSLPPGGTWSVAERVNDGPAMQGQQRNPALVIGFGGTIYVLWQEDRGDNPDIFWSQKSPLGGGWRQPARVHAVSAGAQIQPAVALGPDGSVHATWMDISGGQGRIMAARLPLGSTTWGPPSVVGGSFPANASPDAPDIAVDAAGAVHVVWEDSRDTAAGVDIYHSIQPPRTPDWSTPAALNDDGGSADQTEPRLAPSLGVLAAVWQDERQGDPDIFISWWIPERGGWTANQRVNSDASTGEQATPDLALNRNGGALVAWTDARNTDTAPDIYFRFLAKPQLRTYLPLVLREK